MSFYVTDCSISKPVGYLCDIRINSALQLVINTSTITLLPFNLKKNISTKILFCVKVGYDCSKYDVYGKYGTIDYLC